MNGNGKVSPNGLKFQRKNSFSMENQFLKRLKILRKNIEYDLRSKSLSFFRKSNMCLYEWQRKSITQRVKLLTRKIFLNGISGFEEIKDFENKTLILT